MLSCSDDRLIYIWYIKMFTPGTALWHLLLSLLQQNWSRFKEKDVMDKALHVIRRKWEFACLLHVRIIKRRQAQSELWSFWHAWSRKSRRGGECDWAISSKLRNDLMNAMTLERKWSSRSCLKLNNDGLHSFLLALKKKKRKL
jgi:hypothetical protein